MLSPEVAADPGQWSTARVEYLREPLDACSDPLTHEVVCMFSSQTAKTSLIENVIGFYAHQDPAPILLVEPTGDMLEAFSRERFVYLIRDTPVLRERIADPKQRDSGNTLKRKIFPGGFIALASANSPSSLASRPIRIVICDEVDRYEASAGTEGDPVNLAKKRSTTFWNRRLILISSPGIAGLSRIEQAFLAGDQRRFYVPCPGCGAYQVLRWEGVDWEKREDGTHLPETARYVCQEGCGARWTDVQRWVAVRRGHWQAHAPFRGRASFHLWEAYSPFVRLEDTVTAWLEAQGKPEQLKVFVNTALAETWRLEKVERIEISSLPERVERYGPQAPRGVVAVTVAVDVQDDRLEAEVLGWGLGEENWSLALHRIQGDPSSPELWGRMDAALFDAAIEREDGAKLSILGGCVDTGGHHTEAAYRWAKRHQLKRIWAIKGMAGKRPIWDPRLPGKGSKQRVGRVALHLVGVDTAKELVHARLKIARPKDWQPGEAIPGYCHFPEHRSYSAEYFAQLAAEERVLKHRKGHAYYTWEKKPDARNEAFDLRVYNVAALHGLYALAQLSLERESARLAGVTPPPAPRRRLRQISTGVSL